MQLNTLILCLLTFFSAAEAIIIPIQRVRINDLRSNEPRDSENLGLPIIPSRIARRQGPQIGPTLGQILDAVSSAGAVGPPVTTTTTTVNASPETTTSAAPTSSTESSSASVPTTTSTNSVPQSTPVPAPAADGPRKFVVAHHMVGNTFPYTRQDWSDDINLAYDSGIDGFALNMGRDEWQPDRVNDAYEAAKESGLDFKVFLSLDMTSLPCASQNDAQTLRNLVNSHASHPNQFQYKGKAFVSTFAGETCNFGQGSVPEAWKSQFSQHPDLAGKITFVPSFFVDPATFKDFNGVMDGDFNWNSAWPIQVTNSFAQKAVEELSNQEQSGSLLGVLTQPTAATASLDKVLENAVASALSKTQLALSSFIGSIDTDKQHLDGLTGLSPSAQRRDGESDNLTYMASVSPWFFTHYGANSFNKNFIYLADQHLYSKRWETLISNRDQFDIVQVLTWNDYGESHYIGPIKGAQPNSQAWTDGMDHTAWLELTQYYATAFKTGTFPTIEKDKIVMWSRPHSTKAQAPDPVPQPTNFELFDDVVWAVVMTTAPSTVVLSTSDTTSKTFDVPAGTSKLAIPITPGGFMKGVIQRDGQTVVELQPKDFTFRGSPPNYNFNAFVASATAS